MKRSDLVILVRSIRPSRRSDIMAVSEAIGTVLLLGISVTLAGGIALWTQQISETEQGLYVDLWASVGEGDLLITHRGGDTLEGSGTRITLKDISGGRIEGTYSELKLLEEMPVNDNEWSSGESLKIDIEILDPSFEVVIVSSKPNGVPMVLMKTDLTRDTQSLEHPDLAVTLLGIVNTASNPVSLIDNEGVYNIKVHVTNFGKDMSQEYFSKKADNTYSNLVLFDPDETFIFKDSQMVHYSLAIDGDLPSSDPYFGILHAGDRMEFTFTWDTEEGDERTLGAHSLTAKIIPVPEGEQNYQNNYVSRNFNVDRQILSETIHGPNPGIYDISFSDDTPHSGDDVIVTVIIQNSGDLPLNASDGVAMVVTTWSPEYQTEVSDVSYNWRVDYPGFEGEWRSDKHDIPFADDDTFPTCMVTDIELLPGAYQFYYFTLEARVEVPGGEQWVYAAIDVYDNPERKEAISAGEGDLNDNFALSNLQVLPRILLVDDDEALPGTPGDMTSSVRESLIGSGVSVDNIFIAQEIEDNGAYRDAPAFSYQQGLIAAPALEDYEIVIWVTGYVEDPFTNKPRAADGDPGGNIQELMDFLDSRRYLMIIGESPMKGLSENFAGGNTWMNGGSNSDEEFDDASRFVYGYLGISGLETDVDLKETDNELFGVDTGEGGLTPIPQEGQDYTISMNDQTPLNGLSEYYIPRTEFLDEAEGTDFEIPVGVLTQEDQLVPYVTEKVNMIRSFSYPVGEYGAQYRAALIGFDINQIRYLNEKINLVASVLRWFDWEVNVGRDLAVTGMRLSIITQTGDTTWENFPLSPDNYPKYLDTIEIEVTVRNNGPISESTSVMFYATGPNNIELPISSGIPDPRTENNEVNTNPHDLSSIHSEGGEETVYKLWLAVGVGTYTFRVVVDPYDLIPEVSEENNDISYSTSTITSFVTQNNILIVDDDMSFDNFADNDATYGMKGGLEIGYPSPDQEPSLVVESVLNDMGYDPVTYTVQNDHETGEWALDSGLGILDLKRYNTVIWVTGDSGDRLPDDLETLTVKDILALKDYQDGNYPEVIYLEEDHRENVMLVGRFIIDEMLLLKDTELSVEYYISDFIYDYLGLDPEGTSLEGGSDHIYGPTIGEFTDEVFLGMDHGQDDLSSIFSYNTLPVPDPLVDVYRRTWEGLRTGLGGNDIVATQFEMADDTIGEELYYRTIVHSWQVRTLDHSTPESPLYEMMYLALHWFETPDEHPEIVGRDCKITFENDNPVIGNSFIIVVEIANLGGSPGGGTVRIMDGNTLISSENVYMDPDDVATVEAIWTPLYAGIRDITVILDAYDEHDEVFDIRNNVIGQARRVYYFWDDMESGSENWEHDATLMYMNGESPLDYLDSYGSPLDTDVIYEWDDDLSHAGVWTEDAFHSSPYSFFLKESEGASGTASDIVLGMVIDNSRSMIERTNDDGYTWLEVAQMAAIGFVEGLSDNSAVCLWKFGGANVVQVLPVTSLSGGGRETVYNAIGSISSGQMTSIWDGIGNAYMSVKNVEDIYPDHLKAVVALSDGADYRSNDHSAMQPSKLEAASTDWAPWHDMQPELGYPVVNYAGHIGKYVVPFTNPVPGEWYTSGGASFKGNRMGLISSDVPIYTIGLGLEHYEPPYEPVTNSYPGEGVQSPHALYIGPGSLESGTTEYNLWRISDTSDAQYFYTPDPDDLTDIFAQIGKLLAKPTNQTRGDVPTREDPEPNEDKWAVTQSFDLSRAKSASVSFWNRYNMVDGTNGAFLMVGYRDPTVDTAPAGDGATDWDWKVVIPTSGFYTGNLYLGVDRYDSFGNRILWCWNGISDEGTFGWEYVDFDILSYVPEEYRSDVRLNFSYIQYGGGTGYGWYIDDIKMKVSRMDTNSVTSAESDMWQLTTGSVASGTTHSGTRAWFSGNLQEKDGDFNDGVDTSLYTRPIDLTNAKTARLSAYFKFNVNTASGRPPDGFRVEISTNNGLYWQTLSLGVRSAWGVSGTGEDLADGIEDNKAYTGLGDTHGWVNSNTLTRLQTNLDGFVGNTIILRFRVVTNNVDTSHFDDGSAPKGFYVDDVFVYGTSLEHSRADEEYPTLPEILLNFDKGQKHDDPEGPPAENVDMDMGEELSESYLALPDVDDPHLFPALFVTSFLVAAVAFRRKYIRTYNIITQGV